MPVTIAGIGKLREVRDVQVHVGIRVKLHLIAFHQQERAGCLAIAECLTEVGERLPEALAGAFLRLIRPKQGGEGLAAVGAIALDGEIGQQRAGSIGGELCHRSIVDRYLERAEKGECESSHYSSLYGQSPKRVARGQPRTLTGADFDAFFTVSG